MKRLMREQQVLAVTGLSRSSFRRLIAAGSFAKPVQLTKRTVAWREEDVQRWIDSRPTAGEGEAA